MELDAVEFGGHHTLCSVAKQFHYLTLEKKLSAAEANQALTAFDDFAGQFGDAVQPVRSLVSDLTEQATAIKEKFINTENKKAPTRICSTCSTL